MTDTVTQTWASHDPAPASRWALSLSDPTQRQAAALEAFSTWAAASPADALRQAQTIPDPLLRSEIIAAALEVWQADDPAATQAWLSANPQK